MSSNHYCLGGNSLLNEGMIDAWFNLGIFMARGSTSIISILLQRRNNFTILTDKHVHYITRGILAWTQVQINIFGHKHKTKRKIKAE